MPVTFWKCQPWMDSFVLLDFCFQWGYMMIYVQKILNRKKNMFFLNDIYHWEYQKKSHDLCPKSCIGVEMTMQFAMTTSKHITIYLMNPVMWLKQ
jgi:hypothetical protein